VFDYTDIIGLKNTGALAGRSTMLTCAAVDCLFVRLETV
jgi:hypothetical protein